MQEQPSEATVVVAERICSLTAGGADAPDTMRNPAVVATNNKVAVTRCITVSILYCPS